MCNEELHDLEIIKEIKWGRTRQVDLEDLGEDGRISKFVLIAVEFVGV